MVCVFTSFLLVEFIIAACRRKVNRPGRSFTICLQNGGIRQNLFINRSKSSPEFLVDKGAALC